MLNADRSPNAVSVHAGTSQVDFEIDRPPPAPPGHLLITMVKEAVFCTKNELTLQLVPSRENRVGDCTHCVRPKLRRSSMNFCSCGISGSIWLSGGVFGVQVSENRQYRGLWFMISSGKQSSHGVKEGSCWLVRRAVTEKKSYSGQEGVRRSNIRLPRFLDWVNVESQYKGHPVHTPGDLLRFLQVGPDDRTNTLESRESCSLLSWFAAKFRKNRRLCFVGCPKKVALSTVDFIFFTQNFVWFYKIVWWSDRLEIFRSCSPWPTLFPKMERKFF